jgi:hypothetical protein
MIQIELRKKRKKISESNKKEGRKKKSIRPILTFWKDGGQKWHHLP